MITTSSKVGKQSKITLGSVQQAVVELTAWAKIQEMKRAGVNPVLYFKKYQKRPSWLIELCKEEGIEIKRSNYVKKGEAYLMDIKSFRDYWFRSRLKPFTNLKPTIKQRKEDKQ